MTRIIEALEASYKRMVARWGVNDKIARGIREDIEWIKALLRENAK